MAFTIAGGVKPGAVMEIEKRFYQQLIVGKQESSWEVDDFDEELLAAAHKLEVEQVALRERIEKQQQQKSIFNGISNQFLTTVEHEMEYALSSMQGLLEDSSISKKQWLLLELLHSSKVDISRLQVIIKNIGWLKNDLLTVVNSPTFRQKRSQNTDVNVSDLKLMLNYIGLEQLKMLIPYFCLRHWLPNEHASILWVSRKYWRVANVAAIASRVMSKQSEQDESFIFTLTLMNFMGGALVLKKCAQIFEKIRVQWLKEAGESRNKTIYDAILAIPFPSELVYEHTLRLGSLVNWQVLEQQGFGKSHLSQQLKNIDQTLKFSELNTSCATAIKAIVYAEIFSLEENHQLDPREKQMLLEYYEFSEQECLLLKAQSFRKQNIY